MSPITRLVLAEATEIPREVPSGLVRRSGLPKALAVKARILAWCMVKCRLVITKEWLKLTLAPLTKGIGRRGLETHAYPLFLGLILITSLPLVRQHSPVAVSG